MIVFIDELPMSSSFRSSLSPEQRARSLRLTIDPGFVNHRKIETLIGKNGMNLIDLRIKALPHLPEWQQKVRINHIYTDVLLSWCRSNEVPPLHDLLAAEEHNIFCSTEILAPCKDLFNISRAISHWNPPAKYSSKVEFHYSTSNIFSDTIKAELYQGGIISMVATLVEKKKPMVFHPVVMGSPWLIPDEKLDFDSMWYHGEYYENFIEDFDEFQKVVNEPLPSTAEPMRDISESAFKTCLARILGGPTLKDWGGEASDFYTAHLHLKGTPMTGAFLLKGPGSRFAPMTLNFLGKNNDQIVRLSHEPAEVLFVQHCHEIVPAVRETLRAFSVQPSRPRRYCLIDGRDSLRLLKAFGLWELAFELSSSDQA